MSTKLLPVHFLDVRCHSIPGWVYGGKEQRPSRTWHRLEKAIAELRCPYCSSNVRKREEQNSTSYQYDDPDYPASDGLFQAIVRCCCGWWAYHFSDGSEGQLGQKIHEGVLRTLPVDSYELPIQELASYLDNNFSAIREVHPRKLEALIGELFTSHFDCRVELTGRSHDGGVDLFTVDADEPMAIQVKRRLRKGSESVMAVRDFLGALVVNHVRRGVFVTTAPNFSKFAEDATTEAALEGFLVDLIDFDRLESIFRLSWKPGVSQQGESLWRDLAYLAQRSSGVLESADTSPERHGLLPVDWWQLGGDP